MGEGRILVKLSTIPCSGRDFRVISRPLIGEGCACGLGLFQTHRSRLFTSPILEVKPVGLLVPMSATTVPEVSDSIQRYLVLLQEHGVGSGEATAFFNENRSDANFARRAKAAELLFRHKDRILEELLTLDEEESATKIGCERGAMR